MKRKEPHLRNKPLIIVCRNPLRAFVLERYEGMKHLCWTGEPFRSTFLTASLTISQNDDYGNTH